MNSGRYILRFVECIIYLMLFVSCAKDPLNNEIRDDGVAVKVTMNFSILPLNAPKAEDVTKNVANEGSQFNVYFDNNQNSNEIQTRSAGITSLYNLWVMQFDKDKKLRKATKLSNTPNPIKDMITIEADLLVGEDQTIYLVSLGKQYESVDLSTIKEIQELDNYELQSIRYVDGVAQNIIATDDDIPYAGSCSGLEIVEIKGTGRGYVKYNSNTDFTGGIPIRAMITKVSFDFSYNVPGFTPNMLTLNNVPTTFCINPADDYKSTSFVSLPATIFADTDLDGGKRYVASWYIAANRQGVVNTVTSQQKRYYYYDEVTKKFIGSAPKEATYINLWALDQSVADRYALYYIFLGSNTTTDFNLNQGGHYIMRSDVNVSPNDNDGRVIFRILKPNLDFVASRITKYFAGSLVTAGDSYDIDVSSGRRPIEIMSLRGSVTVEVLETPDGPDPLPVERSWIKLSTSPNYTEAIRRVKGGDINGLATSLQFKFDIPGTTKLYFYHDEYEKYSTLRTDGETLYMRSLYIRFTFKTSPTDPSTSYIYQFRQRPGFYAGQMGGERDNITGVYSHGLVFSNRFDEGKGAYLSYWPSLNDIATAVYPNITTFKQLTDEFKVNNRVSGKESSFLYAENRSKYPNLRLNVDRKSVLIPAPKWTNGKPDLYQYQEEYCNNGGFIARWCYDKNRDENGDGEITGDERVWYVASYDQWMSLGFNYYGDNRAALGGFNLFSATGITSTWHMVNAIYGVNARRVNLPTTDFNPENTMGNQQVRCVRDVDLSKVVLPDGEKIYSAPKVEIENGYAVIDASGLMSGASVYKTKGDKYIRDDERNVRHSVQDVYNSSSYCLIPSARFRVAPQNIDSLGNPTNDIVKSQMTWAAASGFVSSGNNFPLNAELAPADFGCSIYKGRGDVTDSSPLGKWRVPTVKEMQIIDMMDDVMAQSSLSTGYTRLSFNSVLDPTVSNNSAHYYTATEYGDASSSSLSVVWVLKETHTVSSGFISQSKREMVTSPKSIITSRSMVRCVQDLPIK